MRIHKDPEQVRHVNEMTDEQLADFAEQVAKRVIAGMEGVLQLKTEKSLSPKQAAEFVNLHVTTFRRRVKDHIYRGHKNSKGDWHFFASELNEDIRSPKRK